MTNFRIANGWNTFGFMFLISGFVIILFVLSFYTEIFSRTSPEKFPHPIFMPFEQNCSGKKDKKLSKAEILQIQKVHAKWLKNPTTPEGNRANFCEVDLSGADFFMAMFAGANFANAKLHDAKLQKANLTRVNFNGAQLQRAHLGEAMLQQAIFDKDTILHGASLKDAMLYQANLQGADLRQVKGLTQYQINMACLDSHTKLPPGLIHPKACS